MSYGSCETTLQTMPVRENFIKALSLVIEMMETVLPQDIVLVVQTAEEVADRKALREEQRVAESIYREVGWDTGIADGRQTSCRSVGRFLRRKAWSHASIRCL
jgi:hypothetical protein